MTVNSIGVLYTSPDPSCGGGYSVYWDRWCLSGVCDSSRSVPVKWMLFVIQILREQRVWPVFQRGGRNSVVPDPFEEDGSVRCISLLSHLGSYIFWPVMVILIWFVWFWRIAFKTFNVTITLVWGFFRPDTLFELIDRRVYVVNLTWILEDYIICFTGLILIISRWYFFGPFSFKFTSFYSLWFSLYLVCT